MAFAWNNGKKLQIQTSEYLFKIFHIQCSGMNVKFFLQLVLNYSSQ